MKLLSRGLAILLLGGVTGLAQINPVFAALVTSPLNGAQFTAPAEIELKARIFGGGGGLKSVEFFANGNSLGKAELEKNATDPFPPYVLSWHALPEGEYVLTAKAIDVNDRSTVSPGVHIRVTGPISTNPIPVVRLVSPRNNAQFIAPARMLIAAAASEENGHIREVVFRANDQKIGAATKAPFSTIWSNVSAGTYSITAMATDDTGSSAISAPVRVTVKERVAEAFVQRVLPETYTPGAAVEVRLRVLPPSSAAAYAIEDTPPDQWKVPPESIGDGGIWDPMTGKVKFGPFFRSDGKAVPTVQVFSYQAIPPFGESGKKEFHGTVSADGHSSAIAGDHLIRPSARHPADHNPPDNRISIDELTAYAAAWKNGKSWPTPPNPIPVDYVTRAGFLWQSGEAYTFDSHIPQAPEWWVPLGEEPAPIPMPKPMPIIPVPKPIIPMSAVLDQAIKPNINPHGSATRTIQADMAAGSLIVQIRIVPPASVKSYAAEETVPKGLKPSRITGDGIFDSKARVIRWGLFFGRAPRTVSYRLPLTEGVASLPWQGLASFDGVHIPILTGAPGNRDPHGPMERRPGHGWRIHFPAGPPGLYRIEKSSDLQHWIEIGSFRSEGNEIAWEDSESDRAKAFYRAIPVGP